MRTKRQGIASRPDKPMPEPEREPETLTQSQRIKFMNTTLRALDGLEVDEDALREVRYRLTKARLEHKFHDLLIAEPDPDKREAIFDQIDQLKEVIPDFDYKHPGDLPEPVYSDFSDWEEWGVGSEVEP